MVILNMTISNDFSSYLFLAGCALMDTFSMISSICVSGLHAVMGIRFWEGKISGGDLPNQILPCTDTQPSPVPPCNGPHRVQFEFFGLAEVYDVYLPIDAQNV